MKIILSEQNYNLLNEDRASFFKQRFDDMKSRYAQIIQKVEAVDGGTCFFDNINDFLSDDGLYNRLLLLYKTPDPSDTSSKFVNLYISSNVITSKELSFLKNNFFFTNVDDYDDLYKTIINADPTKEKKYFDWLFNTLKNLLANKKWFYIYDNDFDRIITTLENLRPSLQKFNLQTKNNINEFKSFKGLKDYIRETNDDDFRDKESIYKDTLAVTGKRFNLHKISSYKEAKVLGSRSTWCTSADSADGQQHCSVYLQNGALWVLINKINANEKFQIQFNTVVNIRDVQVSNFYDLFKGEDEIILKIWGDKLPRNDEELNRLEMDANTDTNVFKLLRDIYKKTKK